MRVVILLLILYNYNPDIWYQNLSQSFYIHFQDNGWLFAHEAGHCIGGGHLRTKGNISIIIALKQLLFVNKTS